MARHEGPREDLLAEATALVERIELQAPDAVESGPVVIGFRRSGCGSIYFDQDPVYQFNTAGELRRAYLHGLRFKAQAGRLVSLTPRRTETTTELVAGALSAAEQAAALAEMERRLDHLLQAYEQGQIQVIRQAPPDVDLLGRTQKWLAELPRPTRIAAVPNAR